MPYCLRYPFWLLEHPAEEGRGRMKRRQKKGWEGEKIRGGDKGETVGEMERERREQKRKKQNVKGREGRGEVKERDSRKKKGKEADIQEEEGKEVFTLISSSEYM